MDMIRRVLEVLAIGLLTALAGCAGHPQMPQPTGPLRTMNPGMWSYHGNDVVPQEQSKGRAS